MFKKNRISTIPLSRALIYLILLGLIPSLFIFWDYTSKRTKLARIAQTLAELQYKSAIQREKLSVNERVRHHYAHAESSYIDHTLHSLIFLGREKESLEKIMDNKNFSGDEVIEERYRFLSEGSNNLSLVETQVQSSEKMYETHLTLAHPVEIDIDDLQELLLKIETPLAPHAPQLFITDIEITRKKSLGEAEIYSLQKLKLIKREFENDVG